jgi:cobalt-precorrin-5B (C1)-methyltransferase
MGFSLERAEEILQSENGSLDTLWVLGHPGKLAKLLDNHWDTHSKRSNMAMPAIAKVARELGLDISFCDNLAKANTAEAIIEMLAEHAGHKESQLVWQAVENKVSLLIEGKIPSATRICVRLFSMSGIALGAAVNEIELAK